MGDAGGPIDPAQDRPGVIVFPPILMGGQMVVGLLFEWLRPVPLLPPLPARIAGVVIIALGVFLARSAKAAMARVGTNVRPDLPTTALALDGPYRQSRNPIYIAGMTVCLGVACLVNGLWSFLLMIPLALLIHFGVVLREERYLKAKFGDSYRALLARVPRWL
jgi:protein-S-isoprenylcysteine O-methyltransferase Ste14